MPWGVDHVEDVGARLRARLVVRLHRPRHPHGLALDRDAALALDVHPVEVLRPRAALVDDAGELQHPVGQGVDLPWSMCAMMKFLIVAGGVCPGWGALLGHRLLSRVGGGGCSWESGPSEAYGVRRTRAPLSHDGRGRRATASGPSGIWCAGHTDIDRGDRTWDSRRTWHAVQGVPHGRTARRLGGAHLPPRGPPARRATARLPRRHGGVAGLRLHPGFASRLTGEDGSRIFVKAASKKAQAPFAEAYVEEVRKLSLLPDGLAVPRLRWTHEDDLWVVLGFECVEGAQPPPAVGARRARRLPGHPGSRQGERDGAVRLRARADGRRDPPGW